MAEIHVEPKKQTGNTSWIWIVLVLLVAAALVYYFMTRNRTEATTTTTTDSTGYVAEPAPAGTVVMYG